MFSKSKLKAILKKSDTLYSILYALRNCMYKFYLCRYSKSKVDSHTILFNNFNGKGFGDNPKAIALKLHELLPSMKMYWVVDGNDNASTLPPYIKPVRLYTSDYFKILSTSKVWVFNVLVPDGTIKKSNQLYIQTWHGDRAIKKILNDAADDVSTYKKSSSRNVYIENSICDYFVSGSTFGNNMIRSAFGYDGKIIEGGSPRNDCLFCEDTRLTSDLRKRYNLSNKKVLLYAPTFRDHLSDGSTTSDIDLNEILRVLETRDNMNWVCLLRAHSSESLITNCEINDKSKFIDVSKYPDMADLMQLADMLITDYSSSATDYILTGKPVWLYQDDYKLYTTKDRTLYFDMDESPFFVAHNMDEIKNLILSIDEKMASENDLKIMEMYGTNENGNSSQNICRIIVDYIGQEC